MEPLNINIDEKTVKGFGEEWSAYDQSALEAAEHEQLFNAYFHIFPFAELRAGAEGFDAGCGSGRWAKKVAPKVGTLHCIDASAEALSVARANLAGEANCQFHNVSIGTMPFAPGSMDFGYSLGVLHHMPDTAAALKSCTALIKPGAPFLLYLYYALDNRPLWFRALWRASDLVRKGISMLPWRLRLLVTRAIGLSIYWPLARFARLVERLGGNADALPLAYYRSKSLYTMCTDALDRFGTSLEQRFTRHQIIAMMEAAELERITVSETAPYWVAVGRRRA